MGRCTWLKELKGAVANATLDSDTEMARQLNAVNPSCSGIKLCNAMAGTQE